ncbi:MAG: hypothetical protein HUJ99_00085, partial [Bacteroidaceae bacterium]|nr:hypothetical protein [Bacteroidaceae bacterium]
KSVYGPIAADQNWDFTQQSMATRALPGTFPGTWTKDYVLETVFDEHEAIKEIFAKLPEGKAHRDEATPFVFLVPENDDIVITPQFQGKNNLKTLKLHMVVNDNGTYQDYVIWTKGQGMQRKNFSDSNWAGVNDGAGTTLYNVPGVTDGQNKTVYAVRSQQLVIPKGSLPAGATISLYSEVSDSSIGVTYKWYSTNVKDVTTGSSRTYGNSIGYITAKNQADKVTYVACEGGDNMDLNDLIFKMEGVVPVPLVEPFWFKETTAKRYMVEDLGATATSDIDFNDIVVDFDYSFEKEFEIVDVDTEHAYIRLTGETKNYELATTIRALGGVLDMELYTVNG